MSEQTLEVYATRADWDKVFSALEPEMSVLYASVGLTDLPAFRVFRSFAELRAAWGGAALGPAGGGDILITERDIGFALRPINNGPYAGKFLCDAATNPQAVVLSPGGVSADGMLVHGRIAPSSPDAAAVALFDLCARHVGEAFRHIRSYWVGPEAEHLLNKYGIYLTLGSPSASYHVARRGVSFPVSG